MHSHQTVPQCKQELDVALLQWVSQGRSTETPISGPTIVVKSRKFFEMLGLEGTFDASLRWSTRSK